MKNSLSFAFIFLWSSAFVTTKPIVDNSDPFSALAFRFLIVAIGFLIYAKYKKISLSLERKELSHSILSGVLFHGIYLGGVFYSVSLGIPTGITALIVTMQPILTNALAGPILNEKVGWRQWVGVILGFTLMVSVLNFGLINIFKIYPLLQEILKISGSIFLVYLAYWFWSLIFCSSALKSSLLLTVSS